MQKEITAPGNLLNNKGHLNHRGWSRKPLLRYNRENIRAGWHRIKEWDYYAVIGPQYGITFTIADLGYIGLCSAAWLDFEAGAVVQDSEMQMLPRGKLGLPPSSESGVTAFSGKRARMKFVKEGPRRVISINWPTFGKSGTLNGEIIITQRPETDSILVATPFEKQTAFYYNQKINCMPAKGSLQLGGLDHTFSATSSFACLDWGRGVWTYRNTWFWGSASGMVKGVPVGWNIGYGFGDLSTHTENIIFYNGRGHKIDRVRFNIPADGAGKEDYLKPWSFTSNDGRFEMKFEPAIDRASTVNLLLLASIQHQVFGYYTGTLVLDSGKKVAVNRLAGFAEKVYNRW